MTLLKKIKIQHAVLKYFSYFCNRVTVTLPLAQNALLYAKTVSAMFYSNIPFPRRCSCTAEIS